MEKRNPVIPLTPLPIQVRLSLSMIFQAKDKLKLDKWMTAKNVVDANPRIFGRITIVIERDYGFPVQASMHWKAVEIYLIGMNYKIEPKP